MRLARLRPLAFLCLALCAAACGGQLYSDTASVSLGTHTVSVRPGCMSRRINNREGEGGRVYNLTCGDVWVGIKNGELFVNGKSYGGLEDGDAVSVEGGEVFVNSREVAETAPRQTPPERPS